jgi:hypothetical protein
MLLRDVERAMVVDSRVAVYQACGLYRLEQAAGVNRVIDVKKLPCFFFVLGSAAPCKLPPPLACVLEALVSRHGPRDSSKLRGTIVSLVRAVGVDYHAAVAAAGIDCVAPGAAQYLLLEDIWPLSPPLGFSQVCTGPRKWVKLDSATITEALRRCGWP